VNWESYLFIEYECDLYCTVHMLASCREWRKHRTNGGTHFAIDCFMNVHGSLCDTPMVFMSMYGAKWFPAVNDSSFMESWIHGSVESPQFLLKTGLTWHCLRIVYRDLKNFIENRGFLYFSLANKMLS